MKDAELADALRERANAAESLVEKLRANDEDVNEDVLTDVMEGAALVRRAATRIEFGNLGHPQDEIIHMTEERIWGIATAAAGAASAPFMRDHPQYVMPSEEIMEGVTQVLAEMGFVNPPIGYQPTRVEPTA